MSVLNINLAFQKRLFLLPSMPTAYENQSFIPLTHVAYQEVALVPAEPENPTLGDAYRREVGFYQVSLRFPIGDGANAVRTRAELTAEHFKRGTSMTQSGQTILVTRTPTISPAQVIENRFVVFITIFYRSEVFN